MPRTKKILRETLNKRLQLKRSLWLASQTEEDLLKIKQKWAESNKKRREKAENEERELRERLETLEKQTLPPGIDEKDTANNLALISAEKQELQRKLEQYSMRRKNLEEERKKWKKPIPKKTEEERMLLQADRHIRKTVKVRQEVDALTSDMKRNVTTMRLKQSLLTMRRIKVSIETLKMATLELIKTCAQSAVDNYLQGLSSSKQSSKEDDLGQKQSKGPRIRKTGRPRLTEEKRRLRNEKRARYKREQRARLTEEELRLLRKKEAQIARERRAKLLSEAQSCSNREKNSESGKQDADCNSQLTNETTHDKDSNNSPVKGKRPGILIEEERRLRNQNRARLRREQRARLTEEELRLLRLKEAQVARERRRARLSKDESCLNQEKNSESGKQDANCNSQLTNETTQDSNNSQDNGIRRLILTEEKHRLRKLRDAQHKKEKRAKLTEEELRLLRLKNIEYDRKRRAKITEEKRRLIKLKDAQRKKEKRAKLTEEELRMLRLKNAELTKKRRARLSEEKRRLTQENNSKQKKERRAFTAAKNRIMSSVKPKNPVLKKAETEKFPIAINDNPAASGKFVCNVCSQEFDRKCKMKTHYTRHHSESDITAEEKHTENKDS